MINKASGHGCTVLFYSFGRFSPGNGCWFPGFVLGGGGLVRFASRMRIPPKIAFSMALLFLCASFGYCGGSPRAVLLVENVNSSISTEIADHYAAARGIPSCNRCKIKCSTSEIVSRAEFDNNVVEPIRRFLKTPAIAGKIDYIVLTKHTPLGVEYGCASGALSTSSVLTCLDEPGVTMCFENPYGPLYWNPERAFSHQLNLYGRHLYLVTRLDGYTVADVHSLIDRSVACTGPTGPVMIDKKYLGPKPSGSNAVLNQRLHDANLILSSRGIPTIFDDTAAFLSGGVGLAGYFSWGSNDPSYTLSAYRSNTFAPGAIADSYVSNSGRTFNPTFGGQSLVADLISQGASGVCGYVTEPYVAYATHPDVLFDRYTKGFNLAESFYAACPMLFWKSVVVGDPLLAPYATSPEVSFVDPDEPLTGVAELKAVAVDSKGIGRVDFYFDGVGIGSAVNEPHVITVDTTQYNVGSHTVEIRAVQDGPVATENWTSAKVNVINPVSRLRMLADAFGCDDEQGVWCGGQIVTTSTSDIGAGEFYIQEYNGASGIKVIWDGEVSEGDVVTIDGKLTTDDGERSILAESVTVNNQLLTPLAPRGMSNKAGGGADFCPQTRGVTGGKGLRTIGLLAKSWGRVTYAGAEGEDYFYIDDGSRLNDGSGKVGLRIRCRGLNKPQIGSYVVVTGVCGGHAMGNTVVPVLKVRRQSDITISS